MAAGAYETSLHDYVRVLRRRWYLIVGTALIVVATAVGLAVAQRPVYLAEAQMLVQTRSTDSLFDTGLDLRGTDATRAVQTEIQVLEGERVRTRVESDLGLDRQPPPVDARVVGSTDVVSVRVRSNDPEAAATIANAYIGSYIDERREQAVEELLSATAQVQEKIDELQVQADSLAEADPQRAALLSQQAAFRETVNQLQVDTALKTGGASIVRSAEVPNSPIEPTPVRSAILALLIGILLGVAAAFALDYVDDSIRTDEDLERLVDLPVLAVVPIDSPVDNRPVSLSAPGDYAVEIYRGLRTNIQFLGLDRPTKVIQVTSSLPGEGKTTTATNLAVVLAQAGRTVAIVDADLRRPRVHEVFSVPQSPGVIDLLVGDPFDFVSTRLDIGEGIELAVAPSGAVPGNPGELLSSGRTRGLLAELAEQYDYVIVDSAPILPVADSLALASSVDAVLFVAQAKRATKRNVSEALERLGRVQAPVVGMVLNQANASDRAGTYGYGYGYGGYGPTGGKSMTPADAPDPDPEPATDDHAPA